MQRWHLCAGRQAGPPTTASAPREPKSKKNAPQNGAKKVSCLRIFILIKMANTHLKKAGNFKI
jgi:hypothetical protein